MGSGKNEERLAHSLIKSMVLANTPKRKVSKVKRTLQIKSAKTMNGKVNWWKRRMRKRRRDALSNETKSKVKEFMLYAEVSREIPDKKRSNKIY